jgi:hypothetical protein
MPKRTLCIELRDYFVYIGNRIRNATTSAFTQRRQQILPEVFTAMNQVLLNEYYTDNEERITKWEEDFRLLAIDGSRLNLPFSEQLKAEYGWTKNQNQTEDVVQGRVSVMYDVLNELVLDAKLSPIAFGEITLAREHIHHVKQGDLLLLDRGYPSFQLAYEILEHGGHFVIRCKHDFSNITRSFIASGQEESILEIGPKQKGSFKELPYKASHRIKVRLLRILLENGDVELLITSLLDFQKYPYQCFKPLYFKRWGIETLYDRLKNILIVENFSGLSSIAIKQDFYCAIFISNVQSLIIDEASEGLSKACRNRKLKYKINTSVSLGLMKYRIIDIFRNHKPEKALRLLKKELVMHLVPVKPRRCFPRNTAKYRKRLKPRMFSNRKNVV